MQSINLLVKPEKNEFFYITDRDIDYKKNDWVNVYVKNIYFGKCKITYVIEEPLFYLDNRIVSDFTGLSYQKAYIKLRQSFYNKNAVSDNLTALKLIQKEEFIGNKILNLF